METISGCFQLHPVGAIWLEEHDLSLVCAYNEATVGKPVVASQIVGDMALLFSYLAANSFK